MTLHNLKQKGTFGKGQTEEKSGEQGHTNQILKFSNRTIGILTGTFPSDHDDGYMDQGLQKEAGEKIKNIVKDNGLSERVEEFKKIFDPDNPKLIEAFTGISESDHDEDAASKALQQKAAENFKNLFIYPNKCFPISEPFGRMDLISKLTKECGIEKAEAEKITRQLITGKHIVLPDDKKLLCTRLPLTDTAPKYWFEIQ